MIHKSGEGSKKYEKVSPRRERTESDLKVTLEALVLFPVSRERVMVAVV